MLKNLLQGTGVALITPFTREGEIDWTALARVIDHTIDGGVDYLVTLGTTGETPTLSKTEKQEIVRFTIDQAAGRLPVVVGAGGNDTRELIREIEQLPLDKTVAILSACPYYSKPSQEGLFQHYKAIAKASPKPVLLYNVPGRTGRNIDVPTILRLANEVPNIAGIKEAGGDMAHCARLLRDCPKDFLVVSGDDALALVQIAGGMEGVISVAANALPSALCGMVALALDQDFREAKTRNDGLIEAYELMFAENNPAGVKAFLAEMGIIGNYLRLPVVPVSKPLGDSIRNYLKTSGIAGQVYQTKVAADPAFKAT